MALIAAADGLPLSNVRKSTHPVMNGYGCGISIWMVNRSHDWIQNWQSICLQMSQSITVLSHKQVRNFLQVSLAFKESVQCMWRACNVTEEIWGNIYICCYVVPYVYHTAYVWNIISVNVSTRPGLRIRKGCCKTALDNIPIALHTWLYF